MPEHPLPISFLDNSGFEQNMRQIIAKCLSRFLKWLYDTHISEIYDGIRICGLDEFDASKNKPNHHPIIQALELIKNGDPRRFYRIQKRIAYIVNGFCAGGGEYDHALKVCYVDLSQFDLSSDKEDCVLQLARLLIHEATHGEIECRNIKYTQPNYLRIERLCHQEEQRFLARVVPDLTPQEFDGTWWVNYWELTSRQRALLLFKRLRGESSELLS
jgi:hypothetical protein